MRVLTAVLCILATILVSSCYSFKGGSVPSHLKTIAIPLLDDQSGSGEPGLSEKVTNNLLDRFRQDNSLQVVDRERADAVLEGSIVSSLDEPYVVKEGEEVTKWRITLAVKASFQDLRLKKTMWERQFSNFALYNAAEGPAARQAGFAAAINKVAEDMVNETVSGW